MKTTDKCYKVFVSYGYNNYLVESFTSLIEARKYASRQTNYPYGTDIYYYDKNGKHLYGETFALNQKQDGIFINRYYLDKDVHKVEMDSAILYKNGAVRYTELYL